LLFTLLPARRTATWRLGALWACLAYLAAPAAAEGPTAQQQAADLVAHLEHDDYFVREAATRELIALGEPAVPALAEAADALSLEGTCRAVLALREIAAGDQRAASAAAVAALEHLSDSAITAASSRARLALAHFAAVKADAALAELERNGALLTTTDATFGTAEPRLYFGPDWAGGDAGLEPLRWLRNPATFSFRNARVSDAALEHLSALRHAERIELYATDLSLDAARALREALPETTIDWRAGGFLGIQGGEHERGCLVQYVQAGSAAERAGLQPGDVIVAFDGQPLASFEDLTAEISQHRGGAQVRLDVLREGEPLQLDATLDTWQ
jgi:hypothetical protein